MNLSRCTISSSSSCAAMRDETARRDGSAASNEHSDYDESRADVSQIH